MQENTFWLGVWGILSTLILGIIFLCVIYWSDYNTKIVKLIEKGVPPIEVMCVLQDDYGNTSRCIILATKYKEDIK